MLIFFYSLAIVFLLHYLIGKTAILL